MSEMTRKLIRITILDPFALIRAGLKLILENEPDLKVVGDSGDSREALEIVSCQEPDILLLKLNSTGDAGIDIIPKIQEACHQTKIILMTTTEDPQTCKQAIQCGVLGVISQAQPSQVLLKAVRKVYEGEVWIERSMMAYFVSTMSGARRSAALDPDTERINQLSERERDVIRLIGVGLKNKQIASQLCISDATVRHHLTSIFNKLGVSDRLELLVFAVRCGLTKHIS